MKYHKKYYYKYLITIILVVIGTYSSVRNRVKK